MRKTWLSVVAVAAAAFSLVVIAGCEPPLSVNPLSDPASAKADPRLKGVFVANLDGGEAWLHFNPRSAGPVVDVVLIGHDDQQGAMVLHYEGFATQIGSASYLNLRAKKFDDILDQRYTLAPMYLFAKYEIAKDGALTLSVMDDEPATKAIRKKEIDGKVSEGGALSDEKIVTGHGTILTADSAKLSAWVSKSTDLELFDVLGVFRKVDPKFPKAPKK